MSKMHALLRVWATVFVGTYSWHICLYSSTKNKFVRASIYSSMPERTNKYPKSMMMDICSNVGYYTMVAAAAAFNVKGFEYATMIQRSIKNDF